MPEGMGMGTSIALIAIGAILKFAVTASVSGIELETVGTILMVVGILGLVISVLFTFVWSREQPAADRDLTRRW
jgi:hypothetical protein